ncbi:MAG TPA: hypothetical protein VI386_38140 [Candidatus Sulfotelmatobacter sp.]
MALDGFVRCTCIRDGKAKPHPHPGKMELDEANEPTLSIDASDEEWEAHDHWLQDCCEHGGFLISEFLGNITRVQNLRSFLRALQGKPGPLFPILLKEVLYDGTHTGDWIPKEHTKDLLEEVETVLQSTDILSASEKDFFNAMHRLCEASLETGNPILF